MGLFKGQALQNIQWMDQTPETLVWKFPDPDQILQTHSSVIIGPGQSLLFVNEGKPEGIWDKPGRTDIKTANIPILTKLLSVFRAFDSKHKGKIYYFNMNDLPNIKWGTKTTLKYNDPVYKFLVRLQAFGNYTFKITDPMKFFTEFVGDRDSMTTAEFREVINARIQTPITDALASAGHSVVEIDSQREELSAEIAEKITKEFEPFGFTMHDFRVEGTEFDETTQKRVNEIADMQAKAQSINAMSGVDAKSMQNFQTAEQLEALKSAASNEGGGTGSMVGAGVGMGAGVGLGSMMAQGMQQQQGGGQNFVICPKCQAKVPMGSKFCPSCAEAIEKPAVPKPEGKPAK